MGNAKRSRSNKGQCPLGNPLAEDLTLMRQKKERFQMNPMDHTITARSEQALDFLSKCDSSFITNFVKRNHDRPEKMNPILGVLNLKAPKNWEAASEDILMDYLANEESKEDLESCVSRCNRLDEWADVRGKAYEELLEKHQKYPRRKPKPDYACPKCVQFLPAKKLIAVPDAFWGLKPKPEPTTTTTTPMQSSTLVSTTVSTEPDMSMTSPGFDASSWSPPKPTKSVKCGLKQAYGLDSS